MKTRVIAWLAVLCSTRLLRPDRFNFVNFESVDFDISWEDITEDLWP